MLLLSLRDTGSPRASDMHAARLAKDHHHPFTPATRRGPTLKRKMTSTLRAKPILPARSSPVMRLAEHTTTLRAFGLIATLDGRESGVLRHGLVGMRGQRSCDHGMQDYEYTPHPRRRPQRIPLLVSVRP